MINYDPFGINKDVDLFKKEMRKHKLSTDEENKLVNVFRQVSLCNLLVNYTPNLNHSSYIKGFIYDVLNSIISVIELRERYLHLNFRSMVEHIARITLNKTYNGGEFDQTIRTKDFYFLKKNVRDEKWSYLHNVYINACHYVHSSPQANLNFSSRFFTLVKSDCNSSRHSMINNLFKVVSELMKILIKYYHAQLSDIFFRNPKDLNKLMGKSLCTYYQSLLSD
ncbi:hypothetical protein RBA63_13860 [Brenneria goodwinii]|uniref:hypothetical protein n=1 Tax=Brenneria goodwinii TaxID=1109412 RepID=UPI0036E4B45F